MKILVPTLTILNVVACFLYNGSQEINNQKNHHLYTSLPLCSSDNHSASQFSSILRTKENSPPTYNSNSYSKSTNSGTRLSGSLSKRNHSETLQTSVYNLSSFGNDLPSNSAHVEDTVDNSTLAKAPENIASPSPAAMQDTSAIKTTLSRLSSDSRITHNRMTVSEENSIPVSVSMTTPQYKSSSTVAPYFQTDAKMNQSLEPFFPSTGRSKLFFAPNPAAYIQNAKNEFSASADENTTVVSNANNFHLEEARPDSTYIVGTTTLMKEGNTANIYAADILGDYIPLLDVPDMKDKNIIDASYLERYDKTMSNYPKITQKDDFIVIDATDMKNQGTSTVNAQTPSILSANDGNDFESIPILSKYDNADTKSITTDTDIDETISNINPINTKNSFLNYRIYKKINNVISNLNDTKTMLDEAKNTMHFGGDLIASNTNDITSTKHYANEIPMEPKTNTNMNFKITWPLKEGMIEGNQPVQMENITTPINNNIAKTIESNVDNSRIKYHSNILANVNLQTDRNNFKSVSTDGIENVIIMLQGIENLDQDDGGIKEVIFFHPDTSTTYIRRKGYSFNPDIDYTQTAGNKIILPSGITDMVNPLVKYKIKPFTVDSTNPINRVNPRTPITITANDAKAKTDIERSTVKTANFQSNIHPVVSATHLGTVGSAYFSENSVADMTSDSKVNITLSDQSIDSVDESIHLPTNYNQAGGAAVPNLETDFPVYKRYTLLSVAESSTPIPNAQNNQAQNSLLIYDDLLTSPWISDSVAENPHLTNDTMTQKWQINKLSIDPLNIPLEVDFSSPNNAYNVTAHSSKGATNVINRSELMINKATTPEGRPTVATTSLPAKTAGVLTPRTRFGRLIDEEIANEEESTPNVEVESVVEEDSGFQIESLPPAHNSKYFESGDRGFERNGFVSVDTTKSLSPLSSSMPTTEVAISDRDFTPPRGENYVLYAIKPENDRMHFQTLATKTIANDLGKSAVMKQNVEAADGTEFLLPSNSIPQIGRMDKPILHNSYYDVLSDNPLIIIKENPNVVQSIMKHELPLSTLDNADTVDYIDGYQAPAAITSSNAKRLANKGKMAGAQTTNIPLGISTISDDISYGNKNTEVITDLASIAAASPIKKGILTMSEVNTLNNKPIKLGDDLTISRVDPNVSGDDVILLIADPSTVMKSVAHFNHPQATNPSKKTSLGDIIIPKTFHNFTSAALTAAEGSVDTKFYISRYEPENSFKEDITLNYEADPPDGIHIAVEEENTQKEDNVKDHIYVIPISDDNVPAGNDLADKHYSNSDVYSSIRFKGKTQTTADQLEFENPASTYMTEVSKPLLEEFTSESQGKVIVANSNSGDDNGEFFGGDIRYLVLKENVPKGYTFPPERRSTVTTPSFRIPMNDNIAPAPEGSVLLRKGTSRKHFTPYTDEQTDSGTEKDQTAIGSITNSHTGIVPMTFSTTVPSKNMNVGNYYQVSGTGTPLSLEYPNTLRDDEFIILWHGTTAAKENDLNPMDLIVTESDKSDSEYISNKHASELEKGENHLSTKPSEYTRGSNGFVSQTPSSKGEVSKSLLYRIIYPEFDAKDKYQVTFLKEGNTDFDSAATSFKDYTQDFNTQHLKTVVPSLIEAGKTFSPEFLKRSSAEKGTWPEDDDVITLPQVSGLGNTESKDFFLLPTETTATMGEKRTFDTLPVDHAAVITSIKSQSHFYRKGISSNVSNIAAPELEDTHTSGNSKISENKMDLAEVKPSEDHSNPLVKGTASKSENISGGEISKNTIKTASIASINHINVTKMPTNATTISPNVSTFDSKESNENGDSIKPEVDGVLSIKLNSLLIPNWKRPITTVALNKNDDSFSNKPVTVELSEPLGEHFLIKNPNWKITKVQSAFHPLSMLSSAPLKDPTAFSENSINVVTDILSTENGVLNDKTDTMEKETTTLGTEANASFSKDNAIVEDEPFISEAKIPVNLRKVNSANVNPFLLKLDVASAKQKVPGIFKETNPVSTIRTIQLAKARARGSTSLENDNLERAITTSYSQLHHLPQKPTIPLTAFVADFIKINNSELDPAPIIRGSNLKITDESITSNDRIVLTDKKVISPDNIIFTYDNRNIKNGQRYLNSEEKDSATQYEVIPIRKDFSTESDVVFPAEEDHLDNKNLMTMRLDDNDHEYLSEENSFYIGEENSPTTKIPALTQRLYKFGSHAPFPTHVTESLSNENSVELKTKKYQLLTPRKGNPDSDKVGPFLKDYTINFKNKLPRTMTYFLTDEEKIFSPESPDDLSLERGIQSENDIIINLPEDKWIEPIITPDTESVEIVEESRAFSDGVTDPTRSTNPTMSKDWLHKTHTVPHTALYDQRVPSMSLKLKYNQDTGFKAESHHSQDSTAPSVSVNPDTELSFVVEDSENKKNRVSPYFSPMKTPHTMADTTAVSLENSYEGGKSTQPNENNVRSKFPTLQTRESIILMPQALTEDSALISDGSLTDSSKIVSLVPERVTKYLDLIHGTDISENQIIKTQTDLQPHSLDSVIPSANSVTFTRSSIDDGPDLPSTVERKTVNISKIKTDIRPLDTTMEVLSPTQISFFPSEIRKMARLSVEEDTNAKFDLSHITNATVLTPTLEKTLLSAPEPSTLSKSNSNKEEELVVSKAGSFILGDSRTLRKNTFIGRFNISARPQAPPSLKRILSADSTLSHEKTLKPKEKSSALSDEGADPIGLLHNAPAGSYEQLWKSTLFPFDFTNAVSSSRYSELDPAFKVKQDTTTKTNNNTPFQQRNSPSNKDIISPSINTSTEDMLHIIFTNISVQRNFVGKDRNTENEVVFITENISNITSDGEKFPNDEDVISTVFDDTVFEDVIKKCVLEPQEENNNPVTKEPALVYDPKVVGSLPLCSNADVYKHLFQGAPTESKTKKMLQNLISREEHFSSVLDNILNSTDNLNYKVPRSMTYPPTHTSENLHNFLGKIPLKGVTLKEDDTSIIFPEDKRMDYTLASNPDITVNMVNGRKFLDGPIDSLVINSPLENKNQFYSKVIPSATYNTDSQGKAENILLPNIKEKTNMAEMPHSWDSIIPSADFSVITDGKLSFINEEIKILNSEASISSSPTNTGYTVDDTTTLSIENIDRGDSMSPDENIRSKEFLALQIPEKPISISNAPTKNLETFDPVINNHLATSTAWSNMFETMVEYPNSANDGDDPITNKTDLKPYSLTSTNFPIGSTAFVDNLTYKDSDSLPSVNRGTIDISKIKTDEMLYSEPHRTIIKATYPIKVSQNRVYEEGKIANFPDQEDPATKFNAGHITNAIVLSPTGEKILSSVTGSNSLPNSDNNMEEEVSISEMGNFLLRDANTVKENSFTVKSDVSSTNPQAHSNVKGISSVGSTLTLPEESRSNDPSSSTKFAIEEGTIVNSPTGIYRLSSWKPTPRPSDLTIFSSSSKYYKAAPVVKMKKGIITKANNNIPSRESNTPSVKANISPTTIISTKGTKNMIDNNKFGEKTFMEKDTAFVEEASFTEDISEETHDTFLAGQNLLNSNDIVTIIPVDNALEYATNNYIPELVKEGNGPLIGKGTYTTDFSVSESYAPSASVAISEYLTQGYPVDIKTDRKQQNLVPREDIRNSDNDLTALKSSIVHFNTKSPRSMIHSPADSNWTSSPKFPVETVIEYSSPTRDYTIITLSKGKIMEYPFISDTELMTRMEKDRIITADSKDPAVISKPVEYTDQFNRKGVSSVLHNNVAPDGAKPSISVRFDANRHNSNLEDMPHSQNNIVPLAEFSVTPDDDLPFISKNTEDANKASTFSSSLNKASSTMADYIVLSTEDSYEGDDSTLTGEDKVESRGLSSLLTSAIFIPTSLAENPESSGLMTDNSLSESLLPGLEMLKRSTEYGDTINESDVLEGQAIIMKADIHSHPLASNVLLTESSIFSDIPTNGEIDSFFSLDRDTPDNYKTKTDTLYSKSQRTMMKAFSPREDSQNSVHERRKITNLFDQENPAAKSELSHFRNTTVLIPAVGEILPSGIKPNPLSKSNKNREDLFTVKFDATSFRPQTQSNFKKIFLADSTLTLPEASRPASPDKFTDTGGAITSSPLEIDGLRYRSTFPPYFTTFLETSKYSELVPVTTVGEYTNKKTDYNIPFDEIIIPSEEVIIFPNTITSEKDMASTFKGNIFDPKDFIEGETTAETENIYFTEDIPERIEDIFSAGKITPANENYVTIVSDDSGSEYVSDNYGFELEDRANNSLIKTSLAMYAPKTHVPHVPHPIVAALDSLSKATSSEFKAGENYQATIPRQENKNFDPIVLKDSNANVNTNKPITHFLTDSSRTFPSSFSDKSSVQKSTINGIDGPVILSEGSDLGNKIIDYPLLDTKPITDSRTFTTDTNPALKNSDDFLRKNLSPTIYKVATPRRGDTTTSRKLDFTESRTGTAAVPDSRFNNFPLAQNSSRDISNVDEDTESTINTALNFFYLLKKLSTNMPNVPTSTENKNTVSHYSLPSSDSTMSLRLSSMGLPETLILTSNASTKETSAPRRTKDANSYHPTVLTSETLKPVSTDATYFNEGIVSEGRSIKGQRIPKAVHIFYAVLPADATGSSDNMVDVKPKTSATIVTKNKIFAIDASGDQNSERKEMAIKFSTLLPNKYSKPNSYSMREITKASAVKDVATELDENHLTDANKRGNNPAIQVGANFLKDAYLRHYLVNKNVITDNKLVNKDYYSAPGAAYSSFHIPKDSLLDGSVPQETHFMDENSYLPTEVIITIPNDEESSFNMDI